MSCVKYSGTRDIRSGNYFKKSPKEVVGIFGTGQYHENIVELGCVLSRNYRNQGKVWLAIGRNYPS